MQNLRRFYPDVLTIAPCSGFGGATPSFAVENAGHPPVAAYNDPEIGFNAQVQTIQKYGEDGIPRTSVGGASDVTWAFGGEIRWPTGEFDMSPVPVRFPVNSEADVEGLSLPEQVDQAGPMPLYLASARLQQANGLPVFPFITSPIEGARSLCGPELLMRWMLKSPELAHRLLRMATDYSVAVVRYFAKTFDPARMLIYVAAPTASNQMISPKLFQEFVLPYQATLHQETLDFGIKHIFCHICGEQNLNLPFWVDIPMGDPGIASFGHEVDISTAIKFLGNDCIIAGNIEPATIHTGNPETIYQLCLEALQKGSKAPLGFILMPGCGIPPGVPVDSLLILKKAAETYR